MEIDMKTIKRDAYLNELIQMKGNGLIKIITGIRRCGKSFLLDHLFKNRRSWITEEGIVVIGIQEFLLNSNSLDIF